MMTKIELNRLQKLHDFVKTNVKPKHFDMNYYRADYDRDGDLESSGIYTNYCTLQDKSCGTVGCLMGWTPFAFKSTLSKAKLLAKDRYANMNYNEAARHLFGIDADGNDKRWNYLFDSDWASGPDDVSNAAQKRAALKRIKKMLASKGECTPEMIQEMKDNNISYPGEYDDEDEQC